MSINRSAKTSSEGPQLLTRAEVGRLIGSAREANGLPPASVALHRQIQFLTREWISRTRHLQSISTALTILLGVFGFGAAQVISVTGPEYKVFVIICLGLIWVTLLGIQIFIPKEIKDMGPTAELLSMQLVTQRLAVQLALYHHIESIKAERDDRSAVFEVNRLLDEVACRQLVSEGAKLKKVVVDGNHSHWSDTVVSFGRLGFPDDLNSHFINIAQCVSTVFEQAFPNRRFEVKIYLQTNHTITIDANPTSVRVLTSVARYPMSLKQGLGQHGKSWISCKQGPEADVWEAFDSRKVRVYRCVHAADENRIYQTIACIPMPEDMGVVTVEADERSTFLSPDDTSEDGKQIESSDRRTPVANHVISPDLSTSIGSAVKELIVRAIRSDALNGRQMPR